MCVSACFDVLLTCICVHVFHMHSHVCVLMRLCVAWLWLCVCLCVHMLMLLYVSLHPLSNNRGSSYSHWQEVQIFTRKIQQLILCIHLAYQGMQLVSVSQWTEERSTPRDSTQQKWNSPHLHKACLVLWAIDHLMLWKTANRWSIKTGFSHIKIECAKNELKLT